VLALTALVPGGAEARFSVGDPAQAYVEARAAGIGGDHVRSAQLLSTLAQAEPGQVEIAKRALAEALGAGQFDLALQLAGGIPAASLPTDGRMLLVADAVKHRHPDRAVAYLPASGGNGDLTFLSPLISAWDAADRGDLSGATEALDKISANALLAPLRDEERAFILLKFRRTADAEPFARRAIGSAGGRETRIRLALADGFLAAGDKARALMMIDGMSLGEGVARARVNAGRQSGQAIDSSSKALSEVLTAFASDVARLQRTTAPIGLVQAARYADPENTSATVLLALLLAGQKRSDEALGLLRAVPPGDALISQIRDVQVRVLDQGKRYDEAYKIAATAAAARDADVGDFSRLGDVLEAMKRSSAAADAYGRAIDLARAQNIKTDMWPLLLLRASALEEAHRWPETKQALEQGLALSPDQPLLLNFLGYAKLEHGEDLDQAEAMIRKAAELAPDDASVIDSLGWALFKRGKVDEAITTLQTAAEKDPDQAEIQEHLGDALYKSGRRLEARFAWSAALVTAEDDISARVKAKLASGLSVTNAAP
jgi:tetratricopeptide (TPR) repeat protein